ncbi:MAG: MarR family transcriptional regulator [Ardenticatenaceae bacterium]|nr:MarR family transcriptional regulator [Ardenticatenaceae bacterium]
MSIEHEILLAKPFKDEQERAIVNLLHTHNVLFSIMQHTLKPFNINDQHYNILKVIEIHHPNPMQVGVIKELLLNKRGDMTRLLDKLYKLGLIERQTNSDNRRMVDITLSAKGLRTLRLMDEKLESYTRLRKNLTANEAKQLNYLLDKLRGSKPALS